MTLTRCPHCNEELSRIEQLDGKCVSCGRDFEKAPSTSHGEPEDSPYHASASINEPLNLKQKESIGLLIAFLITLATPLGLIYSCYIGIQKGDSMCAAPGCTAEATKQIAYSGGITRGYCDEHAREAASSLSRKQRQFPYVLCVLGFLFLLHYMVSFGEAYTGKVTPPKKPDAKPSDPFRYFLWLTIAGVVGVNGLYWVLARYVC
jgi:hypothetical protein